MNSRSSSDTETNFSTLSEVSEEDSEEVLQRMNESAIRPYLLTHERIVIYSDENSYEQSEASDDEILNNRITSSDWYVLYLLMFYVHAVSYKFLSKLLNLYVL